MTLKRRTIQTLSSIAMAASAAPQIEVDVPNVGSLLAFELHLTQSTTGTLTGANTIDYAIQSIDVKDNGGNWVMQYIRGRDLNELETLFGERGVNTTVPTTSGTSQTRRYYLPLFIAQKDMVARLQVAVAPYSDMASSGATGGTVSLTIVGVYDSMDVGFTTRYTRVSQSIVSGVNRFAPNLPKNRLLYRVAFTIGAEGNLTDVTFSRDGSDEMQALTPGDIIAYEQDHFQSGHVTGQFLLLASPFIPSDRTVLDVNASASDTIQWLLQLRE